MFMEMLEYFGISIVGATVLIVLAKFVLQNLIRRPTDYYDKRELAEENELLSEIRRKQEEKKQEEKKKAAAEKRKKTAAEKKKKAAEEKKPAAKKPAAKTPRKRKPSMNMKKDELLAEAKSRNIKVPAKATKAQILELINEHDNGEK